MKKIMFNTTMFISLLLFNEVGLCIDTHSIPPKRITINSATNSSSDSRKGWSNGIKEPLSAGVWQIKAVGGGWSCWKSDNAIPSVQGAWTWNLYIKRSDKPVSYCFGVCGDWWLYQNEQEVANAISKIEPYLIQLEKQTDIYFWIFDDGDTSDNRGNVVIELSRIK